jgi:hypothetical protein
MVSQPGWAPLSQRLNPVSKSFDRDFKEEWDGMSKEDREEYVRVPAPTKHTTNNKQQTTDVELTIVADISLKLPLALILPRFGHGKANVVGAVRCGEDHW